jgi:hypothetical protein
VAVLLSALAVTHQSEGMSDIDYLFFVSTLDFGKQGTSQGTGFALRMRVNKLGASLDGTH